MNRLSFWLCLPFLALCCLAHAADAPKTPVPDADAIAETPVIPQDSYAGSWLWAVGDKRFRLILTEKGDELTGFHSVEVDGGGKRDMVDGGHQIPSINGHAHGTTTVVRFKSGLAGSEAYGHARITVRGRYLYWELMDSTGEHYFPDYAVLVRQEK